MAIQAYYNTGTASVANGSPTVTGSGTSWLVNVKAGDMFCRAGYSIRIQSVDGIGALTLAENWPGTTLSGSAYEIRITPEGATLAATVRALLETLSSGVLQALAAITGSAGDIIQYVGTAWTNVTMATALEDILTTDDNIIQRKSGVVTERTPAQILTDLNITNGRRIVDYVATANVNISSGLANGQTLDGGTLATGQRVLLAAQTTGSQNGVYDVPASGAASRSSDSNTTALLPSGVEIAVTRGTNGAGSSYVHTTAPGFTLGTTALTFGRRNNQDVATKAAPSFAGVTSTGLVDLSATTAGQIKFPSTQNASADPNTLDDYEEGTFTPTIVGTTTAGVGTYSEQYGFYTKVGNDVEFTMGLTWSAHTGTGNIAGGGLPFTASAGGNIVPFNIIGISVALTANNALVASNSPGSSTFVVRQSPTGAPTINTIPMDTAASLYLSGSFFV